MASKHVIIKTKSNGELEQVFSDKFTDYGYASYLTDWFNRYSQDNSYHLQEVDA